MQSSRHWDGKLKGIHMKTWKIYWFLGTLIFGLLAVAGCESDPVAPQETYDVDGETAEEWSLQAIEMISQMAAAVPLVSQGNFSTLGPEKSTAEPVWDEEQMAWVLDQTVSFSEGDPPTSTGETRVSVWIQFRNQEGPLPTKLGATEMEYRQSAGTTAHSEHEQGTSDLDFDLSCGMVITFQETGYDMNGAGQADIAATVTTENRTESMDLTMTWGLDLVTLSEGCPSGVAFVQVGPYRNDVVYDGQGNAAWALVGPNHTSTGTQTVSCGPVF
jgi:hypothetical protein